MLRAPTIRPVEGHRRRWAAPLPNGGNGRRWAAPLPNGGNGRPLARWIAPLPNGANGPVTPPWQPVPSPNGANGREPRGADAIPLAPGEGPPSSQLVPRRATSRSKAGASKE